MKDGYRSIYLDCYHDSRRSYEYLKLHLVPETDEEAVRQNAATMRKAEAILRKRSRELKKLPTTSKRLAETQDSVSKADITLQEWLARFKEIQKGRGIRDLYAIDRLRGIIADMGGGEVKLKSVDNGVLENRLQDSKRTASQVQDRVQPPMHPDNGTQCRRPRRHHPLQPDEQAVAP